MNNQELRGIIIAALTGAIIIGGVKYLALYVGPDIAPLLSGLPLGIVVSYFLEKKSIMNDYMLNYVFVSIILLVSIILSVILMKYTNLGIHMVTTICLVFWLVINLGKIAYVHNYF